MAIRVHKELINRLIRETYESVDGMAVEWAVRACTNERLPKPREGDTIDDWVNRTGVPSGGKMDSVYFAFCGLLDVDPLAILDFELLDLKSKFAEIRKLIYIVRGLPKKRTDMQDVAAMVLSMYGPDPEWPSDSLASSFFGRNWTTRQFSNSDRWNCTDYILLKAKFDEPCRGRPRAVHISYRRAGAVDNLWRFYGTVLLVDGQLHLFTEGGEQRRMPQVDDDEIRFRTYYGGRQVEWRVASLHTFTLTDEFPFNDQATIGFTW